MISFKKILFMSAVAVTLAPTAMNGDSYESKRGLRLEATEMAEEADDSECGSLEMAEEENTESFTNNWGGNIETTQGSGGNTWNQGSSTTTTQGSGGNTLNQGGKTATTGDSTNTWNQGGETNTWGTGGTTNNENTETSQFSQGEYGGEAENQKLTGGTQSESNINFNSFQKTNNAGTVSPQQ